MAWMKDLHKPTRNDSFPAMRCARQPARLGGGTFVVWTCARGTRRTTVTAAAPRGGELPMPKRRQHANDSRNRAHDDHRRRGGQQRLQLLLIVRRAHVLHPACHGRLEYTICTAVAPRLARLLRQPFRGQQRWPSSGTPQVLIAITVCMVLVTVRALGWVTKENNRRR
jgi:hypothetical protein